jgi:hypothetical protein
MQQPVKTRARALANRNLGLLIILRVSVAAPIAYPFDLNMVARSLSLAAAGTMPILLEGARDLTVSDAVSPASDPMFWRDAEGSIALTANRIGVVDESTPAIDTFDVSRRTQPGFPVRRLAQDILAPRL